MSTEEISNVQQEAQQGDAQAQFKMGGLYGHGSCFEKDIYKAEAWLIRSADQGYLQAQLYLASIYRYKLDDIDSAIKWYTKAAETGDVISQRHLGDIYRLHDEVRDSKISSKWYSLAALQGDSASESALKELNVVNSIEVFKAAAEQGNVLASKQLGDIYFSGDGVEKDFIEARYWYEKAAEKNNQNSKYQLGMIYHKALGVERNLETARYWYQSAFDHGYELAGVRLAEIAREVDPISYERQTCLVEGDGSNEKQIFKPAPPKVDPDLDAGRRPQSTHEQPSVARSLADRYPDNWPLPGIIDDIEYRIQGRFYCRGLQRILLYGEEIPRCTSFEIKRPQKGELEITLFLDDKEVSKYTLLKNEHYDVSLNHIKISKSLKGSANEGYGLTLQSDSIHLTLTTNNCVVTKSVWAEGGIAWPFLIPVGYSRVNWGSLYSRVQE